MTAFLGVDLVVWIAFLCLAGGIVGSVLPVLPGGLLSLAGVGVYWWQSGYISPPLLILVGLMLLGVVTVLVDLFGGPLAARAGGASSLTVGLAAAFGLVLALVTGPIGLILGITGTVFLVEFYRKRDARASLRSAVYATVGVLASAVFQVLLTSTMLVVMLLVHVL